jgi:hypothetical protein
MGRVATMLGAGAVLVVLAASCGGGKDFTASEFVDQVNEQGLSMQLGRQLQTSGGTDELYAVRLPPLPGEPAPAPGQEGGPGASGSLYVYGDTDGAEDELKACRASGGLLCFQASNVVVVLDQEGSGIQARRLGVAMQRLRSE